MSIHEEKSGVQKLRERYDKIKKRIKPSEEILEIFSKREELRVRTGEKSSRKASVFGRGSRF